MAIHYIAQKLTHPKPNLSEEQKLDYNRWVALHSYLSKYAADSGWLKDLLSTHFENVPIFDSDYE